MLKLGATTPSFDRETEEENQIECSHISESAFQSAIKQFEGEIEQVPPVYSAVKVKGKRAFDYARKGEDVKLQARKIVIKEIVVENFNFPFVQIIVRCSKGTYIRSLARDIGEKLGCGAYLYELRRTKIGNFGVEEAITIDFFLDNLSLFETI